MSNYISPRSYRILPPVVKNLIIINVLIYLAAAILASSFRFDLNDFLGLRFPGSEAFFPFQFISYMFLHSMDDLSHLFFNMFALWMFGSTMENYWGPKKFIVYYLVTGIGAAIVHYAVFYFQITPLLLEIESMISSPNAEDFSAFIQSSKFMRSQEIVDNYNQVFLPAISSAQSQGQQLQVVVDFLTFYREAVLNVPNVVGASGAVFGLLLAFGMTFPNSLIYLYFAIPIKAKYFVIGYGIIELFMGIRNSASDNVAHFAHLGGMLFGIILILYWRKKDINRFYNP